MFIVTAVMKMHVFSQPSVQSCRMFTLCGSRGREYTHPASAKKYKATLIMCQKIAADSPLWEYCCKTTKPYGVRYSVDWKWDLYSTLISFSCSCNLFVTLVNRSFMTSWQWKFEILQCLWSLLRLNLFILKRCRQKTCITTERNLINGETLFRLHLFFF